MKVYFKNGNGNEQLIGEADNDKRAMKIIKEFCREKGFNIPYIRCWEAPENNRIIVDVSSHTEFFIVEYE